MLPTPSVPPTAKYHQTNVIRVSKSRFAKFLPFYYQCCLLLDKSAGEVLSLSATAVVQPTNVRAKSFMIIWIRFIEVQ